MAPKLLVMIEWVDSLQQDGEWRLADEFEARKAAKCISVGYLVADGRKVKALAQSIANKGEQISGVVHIPVCSIKRIRKLKG